MTPDADPLTVPFVRQPMAPVVNHDGIEYRWLVSGQDSGGQVAVAEIGLHRGGMSVGRTHSYEDLLLVVLDGELAITVEPSRQLARRGCAIWLPRHVPHRVQAVSGHARALLMIVPAGWETTVLHLGADAPPATLRAAYAAAGVRRNDRKAPDH